MLTPSLSLVLLATAGLIEARSVFPVRHRHLAIKRADDSLTLSSDAVQSGSTNDGSQEIGAAAGEALSRTDPANFINVCSGKTLTNGLQITTGSCNGIRTFPKL